MTNRPKSTQETYTMDKKKEKEEMVKELRKLLKEQKEFALTKEDIMIRLKKITGEDKRKLTGVELKEKTEDFLNCFCNAENEVEFIEAMSHAHQTLQQSYTRFIMRWVGKLAMRGENEYDLRSKNSVILCKKIINLPEQTRYLPMI